MVDIGTAGVINPTLFNGENKRTDLWQIISRQSDYRFTLWCLFRSPFAERLKWNEAEDRYTQTLCKHQAPAATGQAQWDYTITRRTINVWTASCINSPRVRTQRPMYLVYKPRVYVRTICIVGRNEKKKKRHYSRVLILICCLIVKELNILSVLFLQAIFSVNKRGVYLNLMLC